MVEVSEWIAQVVNSVAQAFNQVALVQVVHDELARVLVNIESQVALLVVGEASGDACV